MKYLLTLVKYPLVIVRSMIVWNVNAIRENATNLSLSRRLMALARENEEDDIVAAVFNASDEIASGVVSDGVFDLIARLKRLNYWNRRRCAALDKLADDLVIRIECGFMKAA